MDSQLEIKLIECLGRLDDGEPIDSILAGYPDHAASLRPLLETATALADLRTAPRETARIASRRAFLAQAHKLRESASQRRSWLPRRMAITIAALVAAFIFMGGAVAASASALPSEPLYGVKRAVEDARLLVAGGAEKEQLIASFGQRRRDEINLLLVMQRDTAIAFEGTIEIIRPNGWEVSGLYIYFDQATTVSGTPTLGSHARIQGHIEAGRLLADSISIDPGGSPVLSPTATAKPSATASPSITPSPVPSPSPQPEATPQPTATPQPEATPQPTARPTSVPTHAPTTAPRLRSTVAPPTAVPPTAMPPAAAPPTAAPPTQDSDHSGDGSGDDHGGGGGDNGSGGDDNGGGGSDNGGGGSDGGGGGSGGDTGGGGNGGGGDHGSSGDTGGGGDSGGGDHSGGGGSGDSGGGDHGGGGGEDKP